VLQPNALPCGASMAETAVTARVVLMLCVLAQPRIIPFTNSTHAIHEWEALARIPGWHMPFVNSICQSGIASLGN